MEASTIKFKTIQYINGIKYLTEEQVQDLGYIICDTLGIEKCEENFAIVQDACKTYFECQMSLS